VYNVSIFNEKSLIFGGDGVGGEGYCLLDLVAIVWLACKFRKEVILVQSICFSSRRRFYGL